MVVVNKVVVEISQRYDITVYVIDESNKFFFQKKKIQDIKRHNDVIV